MLINEIFTGIQGEGKNAGLPCIFIRTSGCNLDCKWCDTKYHKNGKKMSIDEIVSRIRSSNVNHVIFTGGEPALQLEDINRIIATLSNVEGFSPYSFEIETNGTFYMRSFKGQVNVSYKLSNAETKNLPLMARDLFYSYKFVVKDEKDIKEIQKIAKQAKEDEKMTVMNESNIYLMPEGATREEQLKNSPKVWRLCEKYSYKFSPRLHILFFDTKRSV